MARPLPQADFMFFFSLHVGIFVMKLVFFISCISNVVTQSFGKEIPVFPNLPGVRNSF